MKLRIVTINDVYILDNLPRLRTLVRKQAEVDPPDALLVTLPGDFLSPSILSSLDAGHGMVDCLNAVGVTHVTFGNHEDDLPPKELLARIEELHAVWLATNVRHLSRDLPASQVLEVRGVRLGLIGVVTNDPSVYRRPPFGGVPFPDANEAALPEIHRLLALEKCAFVIALTHQSAARDRELARAVGSKRMPVICGGHEHDGLLERVGDTLVVKADSDAVTAGVIDIEVEGDDVRVLARMEKAADYDEDADLRARVDRHMNLVRALDDVTVLTLPEGETLSSVGTRSQQTSMGTLVASCLRDALECEGGLFNGGGIRGGRVYEGPLSYGALVTELPFDNDIVAAALPGCVLKEAIAQSRATTSGAYLQVDDRMVVDASGNLTHVAGEPLDESRAYRIALVRSFFDGLDHIEPLVRFSREHPDQVPSASLGRDARTLLTSKFAVELWRGLGGFAVIDANGDSQVTHDEIEAALARNPLHRQPGIAARLVVRALDTNQDGVISPDESKD